GHSCVVFDRSQQAVSELVTDKATGTSSLAALTKQLAKPRAVWLTVPAAVVDETITELLPHLEAGDILIDGGNSYYIDDIKNEQKLILRSKRVRAPAGASTIYQPLVYQSGDQD
ncbi:MAG: NAD(P)-binding domain-containing protein, partial [Candidatus Sulfotelmatobacter sp.]